MEALDLLLQEQRMAHTAGRFRSLNARRNALAALAAAVKRYEPEIAEALHIDLGKCEFEARACEISVVMDELLQTRRKLKRYMKPRRVPTAAFNFLSFGRIYPEPYGQTLIFSAWNYPFQLLMMPLIGAIAAGNTVIVKPAEQAPATARIVEKILKEVFKSEHVAVIQGGRETAEALLKRRFDYIFYTGGPGGGKAVMRAAAEHLTPVTLELGGKSPCIVDADAGLDLAARRIVWGKFLNAGQTCVAPDYILVHKDLKDRLVERLTHYIRQFYGENPALSQDYPRIINHAHFDRLLKLCPEAVHGRNGLYIAPTLMPDATEKDAVMKEEIFGPLLPVLTFDTLSQAIDFVNERPKPLALYYFGKSGRGRILAETSSGGVCLDETVTHLINPAMPFGGVGASGMGAYHGKASFDTFTHYKSVMRKSIWLDLPMRYPPGLAKKLKILKLMSR